MTLRYVKALKQLSFSKMLLINIRTTLLSQPKQGRENIINCFINNGNMLKEAFFQL